MQSQCWWGSAGGGVLGALSAGDLGKQRTDRPRGRKTRGDPGWLVMQLVAVLREQSQREGCQTWPDPAVQSSLLFFVRKIGD